MSAHDIVVDVMRVGDRFQVSDDYHQRIVETVFINEARIDLDGVLAIEAQNVNFTPDYDAVTIQI